MNGDQSVLGSLLATVLAIAIMVYGIAMITGGPGLANRFARWMFRTTAVNPLRALGHAITRQLEMLARWTLRSTGRLISRGTRALGRAVWRGLRALVN